MAFATPLTFPSLRRNKASSSGCSFCLSRQTIRKQVQAQEKPTNPVMSTLSEAGKADLASLSKPMFCHRCATRMEERRPPGDERVRNVCPECHLVAYENPKIVVGCVPVSRDGRRVLLAKRAISPVGTWTVPAGFLEVGENAEMGAMREAWEEARAELDMEPTTLLAVYNILPAKQVQLLYRSIVLNEDSIAPGIESQEVHMFAWEDIPWDKLAFPTVKWALEYSYQHRNAIILVPQLKNR